MSPSPPRYDRWPLALQHAMRLRGVLLPCGPGMRGVGWPDTPLVRLAAIAGSLEGGHVAALLTAAWVWGAAPDPGSPLSVAGSAGQARICRASNTHRYELRLSPADVTMLGEFGVTTPKRTILDLLHLSASFGSDERNACRELLKPAAIDAKQMTDHLAELHRPHVKLARERFREVAAEQTAALL